MDASVAPSASASLAFSHHFALSALDYCIIFIAHVAFWRRHGGRSLCGGKDRRTDEKARRMESSQPSHAKEPSEREGDSTGTTPVAQSKRTSVKRESSYRIVVAFHRTSCETSSSSEKWRRRDAMRCHARRVGTVVAGLHRLVLLLPTRTVGSSNTRFSYRFERFDAVCGKESGRGGGRAAERQCSSD